MQITRLPIEIVVYTFQLLDMGSIIRCRQVCHMFMQTIDSSAAIQYNIELRASCALDGGPSTTIQAQRLHELRRSNRSWKSLKWEENVREIPIRNYAALYELSSGFFLQDVYQGLPIGPGDQFSMLTWIMLPSHGETEQQEWKKCTFDFRVADFCLDVDRDLLVVVERVDTAVHHGGEISFALSCTLHLRSLSTNGPHPAAEKHIIQISFNAESVDYAMTTQLNGDHLGLLLTTKHNRHARNDRFFLWDWTSAVCKGDEAPEEGQWDTFCFLSPDAVLIPDTAMGCLNVYTFTEDAFSFRHAVSLALPETQLACPVMQITVRTEPSPCTPDNGSTCQADPDAAIIVITLEYVVPQAAGEDVIAAGFFIDIGQPQMLVVHRSTLLAFARGGWDGDGGIAAGRMAGIVAWDDWGVLKSRWGVGPCPPRWVCYVHGTRYVSMCDRPSGAHSPVAVSLYDFNVMNAARAIPPPNPDTSTELPKDGNSVEGLSGYVKEAHNVWDPTVIFLPDIFKNPIITMLPYRIVETEKIFDWDSVMIDNERIIGLKEGADEAGLELLDVLVL